MNFHNSSLLLFRKYGLYVIGFGFVWFFLHIILIVWDGFSDELHKSDVAVVFGNQVHPNGKPSQRLQMRLDRTVNLYREGYFQSILVSGATGVEGHDEAKVMKQYLIDRNIPEKIIYVDSSGKNTYKTVEYAKALLTRKEWNSILLISQYFHISRAKLTSYRFGICQVYSAHAIYHFEWREFYSLFREFVGYYAYLSKKYDNETKICGDDLERK